ncbi:uncharacterized protein LOC102558740 isoform X4 [Alligator mississippiensis]|uniref:uncharacterized protein LOC102558740 isoform X4 n=1 Tax=Alligator mississippiensis TaxID=8496 RepID=UPI002877C437|nr:uncharacterized protein LOC102558740 isoform X4 [Alligator mississippiensis]
MIGKEELGPPGPRGLSTWQLAPISLPFITSNSGRDGRKRRPRDCPVQLPQLQIQGKSGMQLAPQPPPGRPVLANRPVWVRAPLLLHPLCQQEEEEDVKTRDLPKGKSQLLHPETLRHRQKLPKLAVQGMGLDKSPQGSVKVESPWKRALAQRDPAHCTSQQGLGRSRDWPGPGLKPFEPQGFNSSPQSRLKVEAPPKRAVAQRDTAPCTPKQGLGRPRDWPRPGLKPFLPQVILAAPAPTTFWWPVPPCAGAAHVLCMSVWGTAVHVHAYVCLRAYSDDYHVCASMWVHVPCIDSLILPCNRISSSRGQGQEQPLICPSKE